MIKSILKFKITLGRNYFDDNACFGKYLVVLYSDAGMVDLLTIMVQLLWNSLLRVAMGPETLIWYLILMCYFVMNLLDNRNLDHEFNKTKQKSLAV